VNATIFPTGPSLLDLTQDLAYPPRRRADRDPGRNAPKKLAIKRTLAIKIERALRDNRKQVKQRRGSGSDAAASRAETRESIGSQSLSSTRLGILWFRLPAGEGFPAKISRAIQPPHKLG